MNSRLVASARLAGMIAVEAAALAACVLVVRSVGVDWSDPVRWLNREATTIDAVMVVVGLLGIVLGVWLLGTTLLYLLAQAARLPRLAAQVRWATLPGVRRAVDEIGRAHV